MPLRQRKPTSAGRRFQSSSDFSEITKDNLPTGAGGGTDPDMPDTTHVADAVTTDAATTDAEAESE